MNIVYILLGSNIGNKTDRLKEAVNHLQNIVKINRYSAAYETAAWGNEVQDSFYNQVLEIETELKVGELMKKCLQIEASMGRRREVKWESRIIDIDILFYNDEVVNDPFITIPHPLLHERMFTLAPLSELEPHLIHPVFNKTISTLKAECQDQLSVVKISSIHSSTI